MPLIRIVESKDLSVTSLRARDYIESRSATRLEPVQKQHTVWDEKQQEKEPPSGKQKVRKG